MAYSNTVVRAHGSTVTIGATTYEDCTIIGVPGISYDLIEKTSLGASRKEYDASDTPDSDEITITMPNTGQAYLASATPATIVVNLTKANKKFTFTGLIIKDQPQPAEVGGLLYRELTIKPTSTATIAAIA